MNLKYLEHLDLKQHAQEWYRYVLPIFVLVLALFLIVFLVIKPTKKQAMWEQERDVRMGLLEIKDDAVYDPAFVTLSPTEMAIAPKAVRFDSPMGTEHGGLSYNAQPFLTDRHLGDDLNGIGGQNSDLGDPVYAVSDGRVIYAGWPTDGWGNVVILLHELPDGRMIETFYGHLDTILVPVGKNVRRGQKVGTVGNANGRYLAHLHFEIRRYPTLDVGAGYAESALGRLSGELSLLKWRGRPDDMLSAAPRESESYRQSLKVNTSGE